MPLDQTSRLGKLLICRHLCNYIAESAYQSVIPKTSILSSFANLFCSVLESSLSLRVLAFLLLIKSDNPQYPATPGIKSNEIIILSVSVVKGIVL